MVEGEFPSSLEHAVDGATHRLNPPRLDHSTNDRRSIAIERQDLLVADLVNETCRVVHRRLTLAVRSRRPTSGTPSISRSVGFSVSGERRPLPNPRSRKLK